MSTFAEQRELLDRSLAANANLVLSVQKALPDAADTPDNVAALNEAQDCLNVMNDFWPRLLKQLGNEEFAEAED